jgi:hypothetical protein
MPNKSGTTHSQFVTVSGCPMRYKECYKFLHLQHEATFFEKTKQDTFVSTKLSHRVRYIFLSVSPFVSRVLPASVQTTVNNGGCFRVEGSH